jgi:hypothetical protein
MKLITVKKRASEAMRGRLVSLVVFIIISYVVNAGYYNTSQLHAATAPGDDNIHPEVIFVATTITQSEYDALVALYYSTDGDNWIENTNWLSNEPIDTWYGITIKNNKVTGLELPNNNLSGSIPSELADLPNLVRLNLAGNDLAGLIPTELGQLENLERLDLSHNNFSDTIPPEIGNLTLLEFLFFDNNNLIGSVPPELGLLVNLEELHLGNNDLTGSVPHELGNIESLEVLHLNNNRFDKFPDISNLENLDRLRIDNNYLTFESIEPNIGVPKNTFEYSPQDSVGEARVENLVTGSPLTIQIEVGGEYNVYQWFRDGEEIPDASSDTYTIAALVPDDAGEYVLRITNTVATELTLFSRPVTVKIMHTDPPVTPVLVSPVHDSSGISLTPVLEWEESERAESYAVWVSENSDMSGPLVDQSTLTETSYELGGLTYDTRYYWYVRAENTVGVSDWSTVWSFTTEGEPARLPHTPVLTSPEDGAVDVVLDLILDWELSEHAGHYSIQLSSDSSFENLITDETGVTETSYSVDNLNYNTVYFWRVMSHNDAGNSSWSEAWSFTTVEEPLQPPPAVSLVSPEEEATDIELITTFIWNASENANYYSLQVSTDVQFSELIVEVGNIEDTVYEQGELSGNTTYYWRVNATNDAGTGDWSAAWSFTTKTAIPDVPMLVSPENDATKISADTTLHWNDSNRAESYRLQVSTVSDFSSTMIDTSGINGTSYGLTNLESSTTYYWRVHAENAGGTSVWSDTWCFTILEITSVAGYGNEIPTEFVLNQNYPNPFNPSTIIRYGLPERSYVKIIVYDALGKLVTQLVDDEQDNGFYEVTFDASHLPSGVYIYRLQAGEYVESKKLLLLK